MPSDNIAELPVTPATANFMTAIATFAAIAPYIALLDSATIHGEARDKKSEAGCNRRSPAAVHCSVRLGHRHCMRHFCPCLFARHPICPPRAVHT
jgi:hypothetical protein